MRGVLLGTGGYYASDLRHTAGVLLPDEGLLLDAGSGTYRVADYLVGTRLQILLTHAHLDHVIGLTQLLVPLALGRLEEVHVWGLGSTLAAVKSHLFATPVFPVLPAVQWHELTAPTARWTLAPALEMGDVSVSYWLQEHPGGSLGFRLTNRAGRSLVYATDTVAREESIPLLKDASLLVHECNFPDRLAEWCEPTGHSSTSQVARLAASAQVRELLLTHVDPTLPADDPLELSVAQVIFPHTRVATDRRAFTVEHPAAPVAKDVVE